MASSHTNQRPAQRLRIQLSPNLALSNVGSGGVFFGQLKRDWPTGGKVITGTYFIKGKDGNLLANPRGTSTVYELNVPKGYKPSTHNISNGPIFEMDSPELKFTELGPKDPTRILALEQIAQVTNRYTHRTHLDYSTMLKNPDYDRRKN